MTARPDRDAGRVSVFLAIGILFVIAFIGIYVDTDGQFRTIDYAENTAAEAARTAGQALDADHVAATGEHRVDPQAAEQAALAYLDQAGVDGEVAFSEDLTAVTVTVWITYRPKVLSLFGVPPRDIPGQHTAVLVAG